MRRAAWRVSIGATAVSMLSLASAPFTGIGPIVDAAACSFSMIGNVVVILGTTTDDTITIRDNPFNSHLECRFGTSGGYTDVGALSGISRIDIDSGIGDDTVSVGDDVSPGSLIVKTVNVALGGGSNDHLKIDDSNEPTGRTFQLSRDTVQISTGTHVVFTGATFVIVLGGTGNDSYTASAPLTAGSVLDGGSGTNSLTVFGTTDADGFWIGSATNTQLRMAGVPVNYPNISSVIVNGLQGNDFVLLSHDDAGVALTLNLGPANALGLPDDDTAVVDSVFPGFSGGTVDGVVTPITIDGGTGKNTLILQDRGDTTGDVVTMTSSQIGAGPSDTFFGAGGSVTYSNLQAISLTSGSGADDIAIQSVAPGLALTVNGRGGNDTLRALAGGKYTLNAGNGAADRLLATANANFTLTNTRLTGHGTQTISGFEKAILTGGASANKINASTFSGSVTLAGKAGNDILTGGPNNDTLDGGTDVDHLNGGGGTDSCLNGEVLTGCP
jgi:hypothetical protein